LRKRDGRRPVCALNTRKAPLWEPGCVIRRKIKRPRIGGAFGVFGSAALGALAQSAQTQRIELDETGRIEVVIGDRTFLECDKILIIERIG